MDTASELAITVSGKLYRHLRAEARRLGVPLEWLVASLIVETIDEGEPAALEPALA